MPILRVDRFTLLDLLYFVLGGSSSGGGLGFALSRACLGPASATLHDEDYTVDPRVARNLHGICNIAIGCHQDGVSICIRVGELEVERVRDEIIRVGGLELCEERVGSQLPSRNIAQIFNVILSCLEAMGISTRGAELEDVGAIINRNCRACDRGYIPGYFTTAVTQCRCIVGN